MHELFTKVLSNRDLSKAGDLFSISDSEILNDLCEVLLEIEQIISLPDYLENNNDQSVVEICITRILSCIRETKTAVTYCSALVKLLESCLQYNLQPKGTNHEDPPHAKISTDIISSIFLNYDKKEVMRIALPVAVKFLGKGNKELSINLASYLSLAAIDYAYLLSPYIDPILTSILAGNYGLCRILPQIYEVAPDELVPHTMVLVRLFSRCDLQAKLALLQLFTLIAQKKPSVLEPHVDQLCEFLADPLTVSAVMTVLLRLVEHRPNLIVEHINKIKSIANADTSKVLLSAQILAAAGKISKDKAQYALDFILEYLPHLDRTSQTILLQETTKLCSSYPVLFTDKVLACVRQKNVLSKPQSFNQPVNESATEKTSGGVTVVKLNSPVVSAALGSMAPTITGLRSIPNQNPNNYTMTANVGNVNGRNNVVTIHTSGMTSTSLNTNYNNTGVVNAGTVVVPPTPPHMGYTRRVKLGDSRSTGKLHPANATLRSGSAGGLYKSMTRLSSSQQISQNGSSFMSANNFNIPIGPTTYITSTNPLGGDVIITGPNKWSVPLAKITSGGVTVTTSPTKIRPYSQGPSSLMESTSALGKFSSDVLSQSSNSIIMQQNSIPLDQGSSTSPFLNTTIQKSVMTLPINSSTTQNDNYEVVISGPMMITSLDANNSDNRSVTLLNTNNSIINQRMSTFEPYQIMRDPVQQFCEKNFQSIKTYMDQVSQHLPPPIRCGIEEKRTKKVAKLHFACQVRGPHCLYSKTCFTMRTRNPKTWIHLMFLDFQVRNYVKEKCVLSTREAGISNLKNIWQILKCESKTFTELVTSHFPSEKDQEILINELRHSGFLDVFEVIKTDLLKSSGSELEYQWGCFLCNHPDKAVGFLQSNNQPVIEGQLKEKKGKWRLFRRWRTRYFTLSGAHLSCKGSRGGESIDVNQIRSVKVSRGARNIPKAFEIFTGDQTLILKPKDGKNAEEWVQCLSIVVAHSQARDNLTVKTNSLPVRGIINNRSTF